MTDYTLLGQSVLMQAAVSSLPASVWPSGRPAVAVLPDGSFFVAQFIADNAGKGTVRMWRLSSALKPMGSVDVDHPGSGGIHTNPAVWAVATTGMKVLLLVGLTTWLPYPAAPTPQQPNVYSCVVDCSAEVPVPGAEVLLGDSIATPPGAYLRDVASDRLIIATNNVPATTWADGSLTGTTVPVLEVFKLSTGQWLSHAVATGNFYADENIPWPIGMGMDVKNPISITLTAGGFYGGSRRYLFTVSLDGLTSTFTSSTAAVPPPGGWYGLLAAGSTYPPLPGGVVNQPETGTTFDYVIGGVVMASLPDVVSITQDAAVENLGSGRYLIFPSPHDAGQHVQLISVDQLAVPPAFEVLDLAYFGMPSPGSGFCTIATDQNLGIMLMATNAANSIGSFGVATQTLMLWAVQGPSNRPNLQGGPLGVAVHFS